MTMIGAIMITSREEITIMCDTTSEKSVNSGDDGGETMEDLNRVL